MIKAHSAMILSLAIASMMNVVTAPKIKKVRASISSEEAAVTCTSSSTQCCTMKRIWQRMGKTTLVDHTDATACCSYFLTTIPESWTWFPLYTNISNEQLSGIPGVYCTSDGKVIGIRWGSQGLVGSIPPEIGNLVNLKYL
jgi:hypothetical protein